MRQETAAKKNARRLHRQTEEVKLTACCPATCQHLALGYHKWQRQLSGFMPRSEARSLPCQGYANANITFPADFQHHCVLGTSATQSNCTCTASFWPVQSSSPSASLSKPSGVLMRPEMPLGKKPPLPFLAPIIRIFKFRKQHDHSAFDPCNQSC